MGLRSQIGWLRSGADRTNATLATLGADIRDLQQKVEALTAVATRIDADVVLNGAETARTEQTILSMQAQLRTITDDLGDRIGALSERLDALARA
jgi:peptidoglycan hydrolase CwlO-like protein